MKDRQMRAAIMQWLVPAVVLVIVVVVMLFDFSSKSRQNASDNVMKLFLNMAEKYAEEVNYEIKGMTAAGKTIMQLIYDEKWISEKKIVAMEEALRGNSDAYAVLYHEGSGLVLLHDGSKMEVSQISYFPEIMQELKEMRESAETVGEPLICYTYVIDDEIGIGNSAIIAALTVAGGEDTFLLYYPVEKLDMLFSQPAFETDAFYAVINAKGEIIKINRNNGVFDEGDIVWDAIENNDENKELMQKAAIRMRNRASGSFDVQIGGVDRRMVYAPVGINNWTLLIGIDRAYVDAQIGEEIKNSEQMILRLTAAVGVFLGLVIVINIIGRIRSNERRKKLEEKADTDLLTGLSNKLATERKIKEYMEKHPTEQALLFVFDVDNFKKINDTMGHAFGDEVLSSLGHQVRAMFRASDVVGRIGGDEFMILLKNLNGDGVVEKEAQKLCDFFKDFRPGQYVKYSATASIGAAVFPKDGKDFGSLYKAADSALYVAKRRGKNQLAFYGEESEKSEEIKRVERNSRVEK